MRPAEGERYLTLDDMGQFLAELADARVHGSAVVCARTSRKGEVRELWASTATATGTILSPAEDFEAMVDQARRHPLPQPAMPELEPPPERTGATLEIEAAAATPPRARANRHGGVHAKQ